MLAAYGSRGDVEPCVALGLELLRRGHDVCLAIPPDRIGLAESAGLAAVGYGPDTRVQLDDAADVLRRVRNPMTALPEIAERFTGTWSAKSATLDSLVAGSDLLVAGMNEQRLAADVAEHHGIPLVGLHFFPPQLLPAGPLHVSMTEAASDAQRRAFGLAEATGPVPAALEIQGYEEFCLPGVAASWGDGAGNRPFVGALTLESATGADDDVLAWIAGGTPPICFGLGSTPIEAPGDTVAMVAGACADLGERALICGGPNDLSGCEAAGHVKTVAAVNHSAVLPMCRALVCHGGAGSTAAGMRAGIPAVILWMWLDQPLWAAAVEELGIGVGRQFAATTRETLVADLRTVLEPGCGARAREIATRTTPPAESAASAAELVERAATGG